jgi:hypothetical protein
MHAKLKSFSQTIANSRKIGKARNMSTANTPIQLHTNSFFAISRQHRL